jgi:hypothetical protein
VISCGQCTKLRPRKLLSSMDIITSSLISLAGHINLLEKIDVAWLPCLILPTRSHPQRSAAGDEFVGRPLIRAS